MSEKKLELYYFEQCPYCQLVMQALRVTGMEEKVQYFDIHEDHKFKEQLMRDTGKSTVPCLYIDGKPMHESRDIANWIHTYAKQLQVDEGRA